jgi:hypothetical protein
MKEPKKYKVTTLLDMTEIPVGALPRFLEELPDILAYMREMRRTAPQQIMAIPKPKKLWWLPESLFRKALIRSFAENHFTGYWVDDDKGTATMRVYAGTTEGEPFYEESSNLKG